MIVSIKPLYNQYSFNLMDHTWLIILTTTLGWASIIVATLGILFILSILCNFSLTQEEKMIKISKILELTPKVMTILLVLNCILLLYTILLINL